MDSALYNSWDIAIKVAAAVGAIVAFAYGMRQYMRGQKWQTASVILSLIDSFSQDKKIQLACAMLDWDEREIGNSEFKKFRFSNKLLVSALRVVEMDEGFTKNESTIRDSFDAFFDFFEKLHAFQRSGLLAFEDMEYFYYWFELLRDVGNYKKIPELDKAISEYIGAYKFKGIQDLLRQYSRNPSRLEIMNK